MIVCSCNVITKQQILDTLMSEAEQGPRTPAQTYRCMGCAPDCGRCLVTVRKIMADARITHCQIGCDHCPAQQQAQGWEDPVQPFAVAAE